MILSDSRLNKEPYFIDPSEDVEILKDTNSVDLFDQNGYHLTKAEQEAFILDLGITRKKLKSLTNEEDRINYIILKGLQQGLDLELEAENYIKPKKERSQTYKDLAELKKSEQIDLLIRLGITRRELKAANNEEKRIELIIKKEQQKTNKNKQNSLK